MKFFLLILFFSLYAYGEENLQLLQEDGLLYADACNGEGCLTFNATQCKLTHDKGLKIITPQKNYGACKEYFQIDKDSIKLVFCRHDIDSLCKQKKQRDSTFICMALEKNIPEWYLYADGDSSSLNILFDLATNGKIVVNKKGKFIKTIYYSKHYLCIDKDGGQSGELIFIDDFNWILLRRTYPIWT